MPLVEALLMSLSSLPDGTPGATSPGAEMFAGLSTALDGTELPSGSVEASVSVAEALDTARLVVQAPDSRASGTRAVAFCHVVMRVLVMSSALPCRPAPTRRTGGR